MHNYIIILLGPLIRVYSTLIALFFILVVLHDPLSWTVNFCHLWFSPITYIERKKNEGTYDWMILVYLLSLLLFQHSVIQGVVEEGIIVLLYLDVVLKWLKVYWRIMENV